MERNKQFTAAAVSVILFSICASGLGKTTYVDDDANAPGDGTSWQTAYRYLQDALTDAKAAEKPVEVRVAQGVYRPDRSSIHPEGTGDRDASFHLLDGVAIRGGFAGVAGADPNTRDVVLYETVLSGDLAGDDVPVFETRDLLTEPTRAENTRYIVTGESCDRSAVLDGFTIRSARGAALYLPENVRPCRPSIRNCTFVGNHGASVSVHAGIEPELIDCLFLRNTSWGGGAIVASLGRGPHPEADKFIVRGCVFAWNLSAGTGKDIPGAGGAINIQCGSPSVIEDCTFLGNTAQIGGAIYSVDKVHIVNCRFIQNVGSEAGGALYFEGTEVNITSCTFFGNVAPYARACYAGGQAVFSSSNTIFWDGGDEIGIAENSPAEVVYSDIQGGWTGKGNINADPCFVNPGHLDPNGTPGDPNDDFFLEGDYHLRSQGGRWDPATEAWVADDVTSPCIDAGDPNSPIGQEPFPNGGRVNMGAYGGTAEAGKSYFGKPPCATVIAGDINGDCKVDLADLLILVNHWLQEGQRAGE
jgi:predicted outer membrane repeat protein